MEDDYYRYEEKIKELAIELDNYRKKYKNLEG